MDLGLSGLKVIMGGATRGISRAAAELFAAEGAQLGLFSRNGDALEEFNSELGGKAVTREFTLEDREGTAGATSPVMPGTDRRHRRMWPRGTRSAPRRASPLLRIVLPLA